MIFTDDQKKAIRKIAKFLTNHFHKIYVLNGYAGTGKSTIITQLLMNSIFKDKKIAMCATTNKAVSVLQQLFPRTNNVNFMTIHKLLKIKRIISNGGEEIFVSQMDTENWNPNANDKSIAYYDIIIIDESSMVGVNLFKQLIHIVKKLKIKIIFVGDKCQLPPINETNSKIFSYDFPCSELTQIMRSNNNIALISQEVRKLQVTNMKLDIKKFLGNGVYRFKNIDLWIDKYVKNYRENQKAIILVYTNNQKNKINLLIRNKLFNNTSNDYVEKELLVFNQYYKIPNTTISFHNSQQAIINKIRTSNISIPNINFEDILNLKIKFKNNSYINLPKVDMPNVACPICYEEEVDFMRETQCKHYFCTGCIITWLEKNKTCPYCRMDLVNNKQDVSIKNQPELSNLINELKEKTENISYKIWDILLYNSSEENAPIKVIHKDSVSQYKKDLDFIKKHLKKIKEFIDSKCLDSFNTILLNRLWEFYYFTFIDSFADVSYGYCVTTHKSQGSTYKYVYLDLLNILLKNPDKQQVYKCLYTATTRASLELNILVK